MQERTFQNPDQIERDEPAEAVDDAIAAHGGDARDTVKALLEKIAFLEAARDRALSLASSWVSWGFVRGKFE